MHTCYSAQGQHLAPPQCVGTRTCIHRLAYEPAPQCMPRQMCPAAGCSNKAVASPPPVCTNKVVGKTYLARAKTPTAPAPLAATGRRVSRGSSELSSSFRAVFASICGQENAATATRPVSQHARQVGVDLTACGSQNPFVAQSESIQFFW